MSSNLRDPYLFVFHFAWKRWKTKQNFWNQRRWSLAAIAWIRIPWNFLITYYRQRDLTLGVFRNIRASKMRILKNCGIDLHFQCHQLQELDDQTQCDHSGEILMKFGWLMSEISNVCFLFLFTFASIMHGLYNTDTPLTMGDNAWLLQHWYTTHNER